jgi:hypothetical protein
LLEVMREDDEREEGEGDGGFHLECCCRMRFTSATASGC